MGGCEKNGKAAIPMAAALHSLIGSQASSMEFSGLLWEIFPINADGLGCAERLRARHKMGRSLPVGNFSLSVCPDK